jgi:predicted Zn finger-like uncharacterized protein
MILTCPSCAANFVVPPAAIGPHGRRVRCSRCKHEWHATAPLITTPADVQSIPQSVKPIPAGSNLPVIAPPASVPIWKSAGFAVVAALLIMLPFFVAKLAPYMAGKSTPPKEVHTGASQAVALEGVPATMLRQEEGRSVLDIKGVLINKSGQLQQVPVLKASGLNARGHVVREWTIPLSSTQLEAGQRLPFSFTTPLLDQGIEDIAFRLM